MLNNWMENLFSIENVEILGALLLHKNESNGKKSA